MSPTHRLLALFLWGLSSTAAAQNCDALFIATSTPIAAAITRTPEHCPNIGWLSGATVFASAPGSVVVQGVTWTFQSWSNGGSSTTTTLVLAPGINIVVATYQQQGATAALTVGSTNPSSGVHVTVSRPDMWNNSTGFTPTSFAYAQPTTTYVTVPAMVAGAPFRRWLLNGTPAGSLPTILVSVGGLTSLTAEYAQLVPGGLVSFGAGCRGSHGVPLTHTASGTPLVAGAVTYALAAALPATPTILMVGVSDQRLFQLPLPFEATPLGAPGCWLYCDHVVMLPGRADGNGRQSIPVAVPDEPSLIGGRIFSQFFAVDFAVNTAGLTSSNAIETRLGGYR